jgi:hypothetical protein
MPWARQYETGSPGSSPLWNLFDLTPEGGTVDWDEQLSY